MIPLYHPHNRKGLLHQVFLLVVVLISLAVICSPVMAGRDVKVALTDLKPTLFTDDHGKPAGFFVDLIEDLAAKENWNIIWIRGTLSRSWERLASDEIDLLPGVTATPEREILYDFSNESALSAWSQVYARHESGINTILDLEGKQVAIVKGDASGLGLRNYAQKFEVNATYLVKDIPTEVFEAVAEGEADALVVFNTAGQEDSKTYGLADTPVMFNPIQFGFAVQKGKNQDLLRAIDPYIAKGKKNYSSTYSLVLQKWFGIKAEDIVPAWVWWGLVGIASLAALFILMNFVLRREVRRKTGELARQNEELQSEIINRTRAEAELVQKNNELQAAYGQLAAMEEELRKNFQELMRSEQALLQARKKLKLLNSLTDQDIKNSFFILTGYIHLVKVAETIDEAQIFFEKVTNIIHSIEETLDFAEKYQNLGINQPKWQNVVYVLINAISHLDFSNISRTVDMRDIEIFADPLLEDAFMALTETIFLQGTDVTHVGLRSQQNTDSITIFLESDGPGILEAEKENVFKWEYEGRGRRSLFLAREILSITNISLEETGKPDKGICFEITIPNGEYRVMDSKEL